MKALALIFFIPSLIFAQESSLKQLADFNDADSNRAQVTVSGKFFEMMAKMEIDSIFDEQVKNLAASIYGMEGYMDFSPATAEKVIDKLGKDKDFEEYAQVSKQDGHFVFYVNEDDGIVSEVIMVAHADTKAYMASVYGKMDVRDIGKMYRLVSMEGFKYINETEEN